MATFIVLVKSANYYPANLDLKTGKRKLTQSREEAHLFKSRRTAEYAANLIEFPFAIGSSTVHIEEAVTA